jgi:hypothetical protein
MTEDDRDLEQEQDREYVTKKDVLEQAKEVYRDVIEAYLAREDRDRDIEKFWDIYNCKLGDEQAYSGKSKVFVPIVRDAVEARTLRFSNALFPSNGRYVECISSTQDTARALTALQNHYVRASRLREVITSLLRAGDITGQYSLYVDWQTRARTVTERQLEEVLTPEGLPTGVQIETEKEVEVEVGLPDVWVIADQDLAVIPATVDNIDDADVVAVTLRATKSWLRERKDQFSPKQYKRAMELFSGASDRKENPNHPDDPKRQAKEAGVKSDKGTKHLMLHQVWCNLKIDGEYTPCYFVAFGPDDFLTIKKNPFWGQRPPIISAPVKKLPGSFWGVSPIKAVAQLQYQANDAVNMGMDAAQYALAPIVMTNPERNPRVGSMVLEMAAVWETSPQDTQILQFPKLWQDALQLVAATKAQIQESFGLNPAMMPMGGSPSRKPTQAQVALEQQVTLEGISDAVRVLESFVLTPLVERIFEYDQQFRDKDASIEHFGELGYEAELERVPPVQWGTRYRFVWNGVQRMQNAQNVQQMIAAMNVLRGVPPAQLGGRTLDVGPILDVLTDTVFGPRLASRILKSPRETLSIDPRLENEMLVQNMPVVPSSMDNDAEHIQMHHMAAMQTGDPTHQIAAHIQLHNRQMQQKAAAQAPQGAPGVPGGAGPGVPGTPRIGGQAVGPRGVAQQPPGAVHPDQMHAPGVMPRKM